MIQDRILTIVNLILVLLAGACIWYIVSVPYIEPAEIRNVRDTLRKMTTYDPPVVTGDGTDAQLYSALDKRFMQPLYSPTPTPTPTPSPTPKPPDLHQGTAAWKIQSMDTESVDFLEERLGEFFSMTLRGPGRETQDAQGQTMQVILDAIDFETMSVTLRTGEQTIEKKF